MAQPQATPKQLAYLSQLAKELGFSDLSAACESLGLALPHSIDEASQVIDAFKVRVDTLSEASQPQPIVSKKTRFLTARALRRIDEGEAPVPAELDEDAVWVLRRLKQLRQVEEALGRPVRSPGINGAGPILVEHLVSYFGSEERVASALGVSKGTVKGWASNLPPIRWYEAEVKTKGHVKVPTSR